MKHDTPLFSIITITYNAANELPATMRSVAEQSFTDFEHLIIDGASKDNTLEVAKSLGTEMMTIYSEPDKGLYDAMNKGLAKARGE
jgi:glycosyltransferase involved in cell wall biosynthesis